MRNRTLPAAALLLVTIGLAGRATAGTATLEFIGEGIVPTDIA